MSKIDEVRAAMVAAMKAKDKVRKDSLSMLLSALKNAEIDKRSPLTEEEENAVVKKELRQSKETYDLAPDEPEYPGGGACHLNQCSLHIRHNRWYQSHIPLPYPALRPGIQPPQDQMAYPPQQAFFRC